MQQLTITLPDEIADLVRAKVSSGEYASESDIVLDGIERLVGSESAFESWLVESVGPAFDRLREHPERGVTVEHVRARIESLRQE